MTKAEREELVAAKCRANKCNDKVRKLHFEQYLHRRWDPHPPVEFQRWWKIQHEHLISGVGVKPAWNCKIFRNKFMEAKQHGVPATEAEVREIMQVPSGGL